MNFFQISKAASALVGLLEEDSTSISDSGLIDQAWRGAEAYHYFLLAQRQLYSGYMESAMRTAMLLRDYEDVLGPRDIYSLIGEAGGFRSPDQRTRY